MLHHDEGYGDERYDSGYTEKQIDRIVSGFLRKMNREALGPEPWLDVALMLGLSQGCCIETDSETGNVLLPTRPEVIRARIAAARKALKAGKPLPEALNALGE